MNILEAIVRLRDDLKLWVTNNLQALREEVDSKSTFSGEYDDLRNKPEIPSKTSQLQNDSNFANIYVGTLAEYEVANGRGLIPGGAIVIITDVDEGVGEIADDIAKLGYAKLGEFILGKEA